MGMPFQVFPTGPPAPPPPPPPSVAKKPSQGHTNGNSAPAPPPPPPPVLPVERKTPVPQSFEPPPMGCRPEIKIPPNPMSNLRKAPRPQPKNDFWIEEYRNERRNDMPNPVQQMPVYSTREADEEGKTYIYASGCTVSLIPIIPYFQSLRIRIFAQINLTFRTIHPIAHQAHPI